MTSVQSPSMRSQLYPMIRQWADQIEATWRQHLDLSPYQLPEELGYIEGRLEGERLIIENRCFQSPEFRKLHIELAQVGNNIDILHSVMFPRDEYALPMFGTDIVCGRGQVSAAIIDLSPINEDHSLPTHYVEQLGQLPSIEFMEPRALPDWGDIFSEYCLFLRPTDEEEEVKFVQRATDFLKIHCQQAIATSPSPTLREQIIAGQRRYCKKQQLNDKTRRVLEKAFGSEWADHYMKTVLFDMPNQTQPASSLQSMSS